MTTSKSLMTICDELVSDVFTGETQKNPSTYLFEGVCVLLDNEKASKTYALMQGVANTKTHFNTALALNTFRHQILGRFNNTGLLIGDAKKDAATLKSIYKMKFSAPLAALIYTVSLNK